MLKVLIDEEKCKGCGLCMAFCPRKALTPASHRNKSSYVPPVVDMAVCIKCGICYDTCPDYAITLKEMDE